MASNWVFLGIQKWVMRVKSRRAEAKLLLRAEVLQPPEAIKTKDFIPANDLPVLSNYEGILPEWYWDCWKCSDPAQFSNYTSWVDARKFLEVCTKSGMNDSVYLSTLANYIDNGADIGCRAEGRWATSCPNDASAYEYGIRVADALQSWIKEGICMGPLKKHEIPWKDVSVSPITVRLKPNGKARLIINLSAPHQDDLDLGCGLPLSVNKGIDTNEFKTKMTSTSELLTAMFWSGPGCLLSKSDLISAYKHYKVRYEDLKLQVISFGGRYFIENRLVFGTKSSPALYNWPAKCVTEASRRMSNMSPKLVVQQLDDVISVVPSHLVQQGRLFNNTYIDNYSYIGGRLATYDDKDKAFALQTSGVCLGIIYHTSSWEWNLPEVKIKQILADIYVLLKESHVTNGRMLSLNGRLTHYSPLIPHGKWYRTPLLSLQDTEGRKSKTFAITEDARRCAVFWKKVFNRLRLGNLPIPDIRGGCPASSVPIFSDASGTPDLARNNSGAAAYCFNGTWAWYRWPGSYGWRFKYGHQTSFLEGVAALMALLVGICSFGRRPIIVPCDNQGFVHIYTKGHSRCPFAWTVAKGIHDLADGLGVNFSIIKTPRVSGPGEWAADKLSRDESNKVREVMPLNEIPIKLPKALIKFLRNPVQRDDLGWEILSELESVYPVLPRVW